MEVTLNGKKTELPEAISNLTQLLTHYKLEDKVVIVEVNGEIIDKSKHEDRSIEAGDQIELVHFVGGG
ncbi:MULTISPECIES: sulfur carrier protein ThiS [Bacillaceae]|uniref:Sulfur carrier protein ThiS n=1 Tax=Evansella alkalicola TaxID=745819 RepID=A0ABS6JP04_9BACI|nr:MULTISPECIES: sulfur carrier protein ThiS [Bacillaceae]MBU9719992.1 sulfur carrier protein ThiS [Bacillus alkalicola]